MKRQLALGAAVALLGASLVACADPTVQRPAVVDGGSADRTSPGTAPGADPTSAVGETQQEGGTGGADGGQEGQQ